MNGPKKQIPQAKLMGFWGGLEASARNALFLQFDLPMMNDRQRAPEDARGKHDVQQPTYHFWSPWD